MMFFVGVLIVSSMLPPYHHGSYYFVRHLRHSKSACGHSRWNKSSTCFDFHGVDGSEHPPDQPELNK